MGQVSAVSHSSRGPSISSAGSAMVKSPLGFLSYRVPAQRLLGGLWCMLQATLCFSSYFLRTNIPEQFYGPLASCPSLPSPLSLLSAFFFPQVLHSCALLGSFVFFGKPSTQPFLWKFFLGLFFLPSTRGECEKKQRKYSINVRKGGLPQPAALVSRGRISSPGCLLRLS